MKKLLLLTSLAIASTFATANQEPFKLELDRANESGMLKLYITTRMDAVRIDDVIVDRGRCPVLKEDAFNGKHLPKKLSFGERGKIYIQDCRSISEVTIVTDQGNITYTFD